MAETPPLLEEDAEAAWELFVLGVDERSPATQGDAESAAWFRAQLQELGFTQGSFARWMQRRGDVRSKRNVLRSIQRMRAGQTGVSGEMRVLLGLMLRSKQRKMARAARERDERNAPWNDPPEARGEQGKRHGREAPAVDPPGARGGWEAPDERGAPPTIRPEHAEHGESRPSGAPPGDLSGTRSEPGIPGAREAAPGADPAETRHAQEEQDGRDPPPSGHSSETRGGRPSGNGMAGR